MSSYANNKSLKAKVGKFRAPETKEYFKSGLLETW